jgi:hypothetical protein
MKPGFSRDWKRRAGAAFVLALAAGCLSQEEIRRIESRPEGTGIQFSRLPEMVKILATYEATPVQRQQARARAVDYQRRRDETRNEAATAAAGTEPQYVAVQVEPDERKQGEAQVMIWDTRAAEFIDNSVYDVEEAPREGAEMRWETRSATLAAVYIGARPGG